MKSLILVICSVIVPSASMSLYAQDSLGTVYGYVINASKADVPSKSSNKLKSRNGIAEQEVVLYKYLDGQATEGVRPHASTNVNGRFEFHGLEVGKRFAYYPVVNFMGVEYYGEIVTLKSDTVRQQSDVPVFEITQSDSSITAAMHHIIINPGVGILNVREILFFENRSRYTYVGQVPAGPPNKKVVLQLDVPVDAADVKFGGELMSCCAVIDENHIFDTMAFKPGMRQIKVDYLLPYKGRQASLIKRVAYKTGAVDIFIPENSGMLKSEGFKSQPFFMIRGQNYQRFNAKNLAAGLMLNLNITGLSPKALDYRWLAPAILIGIIILVYGAHRWRKPKIRSRKLSDVEVSEGPYTKERRRLLNEIIQLDDAFEAGNIDDSTYYTARENLKQLVLELDSENQNTDAIKLNN